MNAMINAGCIMSWIMTSCLLLLLGGTILYCVFVIVSDLIDSFREKIKGYCGRR